MRGLIAHLAHGCSHVVGVSQWEESVPLAEPDLLLFLWVKLCQDSKLSPLHCIQVPHCIPALASAVAEAREDGVKGAEPGWLSSLIPGVEFPSSHVLRGHTLKVGEGRLQAFSRWFFTPGSKELDLPNPAPVCTAQAPAALSVSRCPDSQDFCESPVQGQHLARIGGF